MKKHILKLSGGKDSEACLWWCYDNLPFDCWEVWYNDTEWESPLLYAPGHERVYQRVQYMRRSK